MKTKIIKVDENNIDKELIKEGAEIIEKGGLVAFPTETVYGLGAKGLDEEAVKKVFAAKGRPQDNPLILHVSNPEEIGELVEEIPDMARLCMERFWPGPLTILFRKSPKVPNIITGGLDTVAIRMPQHNIALELIKLAKTPIAAPSANISGKPSPTSAKHVVEDLMGKVDMIIDGGNTGIGLESTVLDLSGDIPMILRPGGVTLEELRQIIPKTQVDSAIINEEEGLIPKSPGQKYKHYAPKAEMIVFSGDTQKMIESIIIRTKEYRAKGKKIGIICTDETRRFYGEFEDIVVISLGSREKQETIAHSLFSTLRLFDKENVDIILSEGVDYSDLGVAIMNRMMKASSGRIIRV